MANRKTLSHVQIVRDRIRTSQLVKRLQGFVEGKLDPKTKRPIELSSPQVRAALGLLRKTLPDLTAVTHSGKIEFTKPETLSDEQLADIASGRRGGAPEATLREEEPDQLH
jgi:hypothetical protein